MERNLKLKLSILVLAVLAVLALGAVVYDHIYPSTTATYDVGTSALKWRNGYFSGDVSASTFSNLERSADPDLPSEGYSVIWMSDGTGLGGDGDIMIASTAAGNRNYGTIFDHSGGTAWTIKLLLETGDIILLETGDKILNEI